MVVRQEERERFAIGLGRAREAAFPPGEYVGQESFMTAGEIRLLAGRAGLGPGTSMLDLCCGVAGPGRLLAAESGCAYLGVDSSAAALRLARGLARGLAERLAEGPACSFECAEVPPLPAGPFDVVLLLETMLAFPDKPALVDAVARALVPGGRFAFTVEEGAPLTAAERATMPDADTVWLVELADLTAMLCEAGLSITWQQSLTEAHAATAAALLAAYRADDDWIARHVGPRALGDLLAAHEQWCAWLRSGRVHKYAVVAQKR